jgi:hypothetical protein
MNETALDVAIVGHTNTGKTSLLRTLTRDRQFGLVDDAPGTTRDVVSAPVYLGDAPALVWFDTPGLEDSVALRDWIEGLSHPTKRLDGVERMERFLADPVARVQFEQESRVLAQVLNSDALLYVVDARDPVLAKHRDELYLLQACAKPVLPVLNFVASPQANTQPWIQMFARSALHIHLSFDTISPPINGLQMMYDTLGQLLAARGPLLRALSQEVAKERRQRVAAAVGLLADLSVQAAAVRFRVKDEPDEIVLATDRLQEAVRALERRFVDQLLALYQFSDQDYLPQAMGWADGHWSTDLFDKRTLSALGIDLGKGAAMGGAIGATFDVLSAGLSLGAGTLIGATAGSAWQGLGRWGKDLRAKVMGQRELMAGDVPLMVLVTRNVQLIAALEQRGHASQQPVVLNQTHKPVTERQAKDLINLFNAARRQSLRWDIIGLAQSNQPQRALVKQAEGVIGQAAALRVFLSDELHS